MTSGQVGTGWTLRKVDADEADSAIRALDLLRGQRR
jgi:hypothetical protein